MNNKLIKLWYQTHSLKRFVLLAINYVIERRVFAVKIDDLEEYNKVFSEEWPSCHFFKGITP